MTSYAPPRTLGVFSLLNGLVLAGVVLQGLFAAGLITHEGSVTWRLLHGITGSLITVLALAAAILALATLRGHGALARSSTTLALLLILQSALGSTIKAVSGLTLVHVPLALLIMGLGVHLSIAAARALRPASSG